MQKRPGPSPGSILKSSLKKNPAAPFTPEGEQNVSFIRQIYI